MKQAFVRKKFRADSIAIIKLANGILEEYAENGISLTLRQLYYQFVARDLFPASWVDPDTGTKNNLKNYKRLGGLVSDARDAGLLDWAAIEDRNRQTMALQHWASGGQIVQAAARSFRLDHWANQPWHVEVLVEKDAATSVLLPTCHELDVNFTANKGYGSSTLLYDVGRRVARKMGEGKKILVLYCGDHDPSGLDMTRDVEERLTLYSGGRPVEVRRLALNHDQVLLWDPPENPTKETDSRAAAYMAEYGETCWELDAVEPLALRDLVRKAVLSVRDDDRLAETMASEQATLERLADFAATFEGRRRAGDDGPYEDEDE